MVHGVWRTACKVWCSFRDAVMVCLHISCFKRAGSTHAAQPHDLGGSQSALHDGISDCIIRHRSVSYIIIIIAAAAAATSHTSISPLHHRPPWFREPHRQIYCPQISSCDKCDITQTYVSSINVSDKDNVYCCCCSFSFMIVLAPLVDASSWIPIFLRLTFADFL